MYAVDAQARPSRWVSASPTAAGPSSSRLSSTSGTGTTNEDQTAIDSPDLTPARRDTTLPTPQESAPPTQSSSASSGT